MKTLVVNGCSYGDRWQVVGDLAKRLGFEKSVNLSRSGASNPRIFRTTLNYVAEHKPDFVIIMLTGWDRLEAPWGEFTDDFTEGWVDYGPNGVLNQSVYTEFPKNFYQGYIQDRYRYDVDIRYVEKILYELTSLTGWLESQNTKYLVFSSCSGLFTEVEKSDRYGAKLDLLKSNPRIIDLETWCSNRYLYEKGATCTPKDINQQPEYMHFEPTGYFYLNDFVYNHIIDNDLL